MAFSEEVIKKAVSNGKSTTNGTLNKTSSVVSKPGGSASVNYNDKRFQQVNTDKQNALNEVDQTYGEMIGGVDDKYQTLIDNSQKWADEQIKNQNEQTDFAIEKIEQEKEKAEKDYTKEQSGAYVDWQKQSGQYGVNAEQMASMGMTNTGYSESSQVAMYTAYQNRVAVAREVFNNAILNYNNAIKDAKLQNNSVIAEISYKALKEQSEFALEGFKYKNQLILDKANKKAEVEDRYYNRYRDVLAQINQENALAEQIRQFNESQAFKEKQFAEEQRQFNEQLALQKSKSSSSGSSGGTTANATLKKNDTVTVDENKTTTNNTQNTSNNTTGATLDTKSVLSLGKGALNGDAVAELVAKGKAKAIQSGNKIVVAPAINSKTLLTGATPLFPTTSKLKLPQTPQVKR